MKPAMPRRLPALLRPLLAALPPPPRRLAPAFIHPLLSRREGDHLRGRPGPPLRDYPEREVYLPYNPTFPTD
jgi:hypothetical protein